MNFGPRIKRKIKEYNPKGGLGQTAMVLLDLLSISHPLVRKHAERVALLAEAVALKMKKDAKAAFFAGLLHDTGKASIPNHLFDGRDITEEEYAEVKKHSLAGFLALRKKHLFTAYCAGFHHALNAKGYGLKLRDFPRNWELQTVKKLLEIATIIAICDYIDAAFTRDGVMKSDMEAPGADLRERLEKKFPDDLEVVRIALGEAKKIIR
jgi:putative nucleotidyltransferase with HDIG domain